MIDPPPSTRGNTVVAVKISAGALDICVTGDSIRRYVRIGRNLFDLIGSPGGFVFESRRCT